MLMKLYEACETTYFAYYIQIHPRGQGPAGKIYTYTAREEIQTKRSKQTGFACDPDFLGAGNEEELQSPSVPLLSAGRQAAS